jgi:hypothetical protein
VTGLARAFRQTVHAGAQHVDATDRRKVQVRDALTPERTRASFDGRGNVIHLQIGEYLQIEGSHAGDRLRACGGIQLEADLRDSEPRSNLARDLFRRFEVRNVERDCEPISCVGHAASTSGAPSPVQ